MVIQERDCKMDKKTEICIDSDLCTGCQRCHGVCPAGAIAGDAGCAQTIDTARCVRCGQCVQICMVYASIYEQRETDLQKKKLAQGLLPTYRGPIFAAHYCGESQKIYEVLQASSLYKIVQCAPAVRVSLAEEFGMDFGTLTPGKMAAALRQLGFDAVYDTNFSADLTVMEETAELLWRIENKGVLPMFTSCCPAWVRYIETRHPELMAHLSSCKSPQQMAGAVFKTYGAKISGIAPEQMYSVAVMPCTAKGHEARRPEMAARGYADVDAVLTTRELAALLKAHGVDFHTLPEAEFDYPFGLYSGAGTIFGTAGGVMEAALRTVSVQLTGKVFDKEAVQTLYAGNGKREMRVKMGEGSLRAWTVAGLEPVEELLQQVKEKAADFQFMEVMSCPHGCISGGGQPKLCLETERQEAFAKRKQGLYQEDAAQNVHASHENPAIQKIYKEFLGKPLGPISHALLHTKYGENNKTEMAEG